MNVSLGRVILYVHDVPLLANFYRRWFGFEAVEEIEGEWVVFTVGNCEFALHLAGSEFRNRLGPASNGNSNAKLVFAVDRDLAELRGEMIAGGVAMGEIKSYSGLTGPLCDGRDPEDNVFQLSFQPT